MRLQPVSVGVIALLLLVWAGVRHASACTCAGDGGPSCQNAFQVDAVFSGRVASLTQILRVDPSAPDDVERQLHVVRVEFADVETFLGPRTPATSVFTMREESLCGYSFEEGERYVVYAHRSADGTFGASICSRTRPLSEAGDDLRFLRTLAGQPPARARISGTVKHWERDLARDEPTDGGPVPNALITLRGVSKTFHATTDRRGRYDVLVPPDRYEIDATAAAPLVPLFRGPQSVTLPDPRACFVADFLFSFGGRISGAVRLASGEPAVGVDVQLVAASDAGKIGKTGDIHTLRERSDSSGRFEFTELPSGRYLVGIDLTRETDRELMFPPTFHPGTGNAASATIVRLKDGEHRTLEPIALPASRRVRQLTGTVVFPDGTPVPKVDVLVLDSNQPWRPVTYARIVTASDGTFSMTVHDGLSYVVVAAYWNDRSQRRQEVARVGPFLVSPDTQPLRLQVTAATLRRLP